MYEYEIRNNKTNEKKIVFFHFDFMLWREYNSNEWSIDTKEYID